MNRIMKSKFGAWRNPSSFFSERKIK